MAIPVALGVAAAAAAKGGGAAAGGGMLSGLGAGLLGAGSSIFGGLLGRDTQEKLTQKQIDLQREFAQHGIRWRVEDAKAAGLHPLAALGAFPTSYNPIIMEDPLGKAVADAGQDISGAIARTQTEEERLSTRLNQDLLRAHINESDMRSLAIQNDIQRKATEAPVPGFPMLQREGPDGQAPAIPSAGDPRGFFEVKPPQRMTSSINDPAGEPGTSPSWEMVQYPGFKMMMPSGRGQETPMEIWNEMPAYEKWGWIMHNAHKQGWSWLDKYVDFMLTGATMRDRFKDMKPLFPLPPKRKDYKGDDILGARDRIWSEIDRMGKSWNNRRR